MITFKQALVTIMENTNVLGEEVVDINDSLFRVLNEDVLSDINMPPFDKSAMDGYACRKSDLKNKLEIIEIIPAGKVPQKKIGINQCSKIMTGAIVPDGADCVVKVENTSLTEGGMVRIIDGLNQYNICPLGQDIKKGDKVLNKGVKISPIHIAVLSETGVVRPKVVKLPRVGLICTGSELVEPDVTPGISQIRNSNANQLIAQIRVAGAIPNYYGIIEDTIEATREIISSVISENDMIIITGGVSAGDFDYVPQAMKEAGFDMLFESIAIQPGKPCKFAKLGEKTGFGLPGNPVSCLILFDLLIKPALKKMMGEIYKPELREYRLGNDYKRINVEREAFIPVKITEEGLVSAIKYHGSAHINSYTGVDGVISIPIGISKLKKGEIVDVRQV